MSEEKSNKDKDKRIMDAIKDILEDRGVINKNNLDGYNEALMDAMKVWIEPDKAFSKFCITCKKARLRRWFVANENKQINFIDEIYNSYEDLICKYAKGFLDDLYYREHVLDGFS